jgi:hypothetical protein
LWESGHIEVVEYAIRLLRAHYPDMKYLESLVALFDGLPRNLPAPLAFCDDRRLKFKSFGVPAAMRFCSAFARATALSVCLSISFISGWVDCLRASCTSRTFAI